MKFKLTWPAGIVISIGSFIIFILYFVIKASIFPEYNHHLVSDEYYKEELNYQQEIDKLTNASVLEENVYVEKTIEGLVIHFPSNLEPSKIAGTIVFKRLSNNKIDFKIPIQLNSHQYLINDSDLVAGKWNIKIEWSINETTYLFKEQIMY